MRKIAGEWLRQKKNRADQEAARKRREAQEAQARAREAALHQDGTIESQLAAKRLQEDAERAAAAAARVPDRARIKGDFAAKAMSLRQHWHAEVTDENKAVRHYRDHPEVKRVVIEKVLQLASALARAEKRADAAPPGFRFIMTETPV